MGANGKDKPTESPPLGSRDNPIDSLGKFCEWVAGLDNSPYSAWIYRGLKEENYADDGITSAAFRRLGGRNKTSEGLLRYQQSLIYDVRTRGFDAAQGRSKYDLEILAELQHQGAATCLIDFTMDPFAALWFACQENEKKKGMVFALNAGDINRYLEVTLKDLEEKKIKDFFDSPEIWKWNPTSVHVNRVLAQKSIFVFGQSRQTKKEGITKEEGKYCIISAAAKKQLENALKRKFGINKKNLFYDFTGLAQAHGLGETYTRTVDDALADSHQAYQRRDFEQAIDYYTEAIELTPKDARLYYYRATTNKVRCANVPMAREKCEKIMREEIIGDFDTAIKLEPKNATFHHFRGWINTELGDLFGKGNHEDYRAAVNDYKVALVLDPKNATTRCNIGHLKVKLGEYEAAIKDLDKVIDLDPKNYSAYYFLGCAKAKLGRHDEAINDFGEAIAHTHDPQFAAPYHNRGVCKKALGDMKEAEEDFKRARELGFKKDTFTLVL